VSPQTEMARRMADLARAVQPLFTTRGFRKRRNVFNRETEPGLVQVVAFTMGRYELYGDQHDPFAGDYGRMGDDARRLLARHLRGEALTDGHGVARATPRPDDAPAGPERATGRHGESCRVGCAPHPGGVCSTRHPLSSSPRTVAGARCPL